MCTQVYPHIPVQIFIGIGYADLCRGIKRGELGIFGHAFQSVVLLPRLSDPPFCSGIPCLFRYAPIFGYKKRRVWVCLSMVVLMSRFSEPPWYAVCVEVYTRLGVCSVWNPSKTFEYPHVWQGAVFVPVMPAGAVR